jgi:hypothetical protein
MNIAPTIPEYIATLPRLHRSLCLGRTVSLDARDWELHEEGSHPGGTTSGEMLTYKHRQDQYRMFMNLESGEEWSLPGQRQDQSADDRQMYNFLRQYAVSHLGKLGANIYGLHLFFKDGLSQFGMTYRMERYWTRKISVIIPNRITGKMAEFVFTFGFNGSFPQYCLNAHIMDQMVASLQWL